MRIKPFQTVCSLLLFCLILSCQIAHTADFPKIDQAWQMTSTDMNSRMAIFYPDDENILYVENYPVKAQDHDLFFYKLNIDSEERELIGSTFCALYFGCHETTRPFWVDVDKQLFGIFYDKAKSTKLFVMSQFGEIIYKFEEIHRMCSGGITSLSLRFSQDMSNIASYCDQAPNSYISFLPAEKYFDPNSPDKSDFFTLDIGKKDNSKTWYYQIEDWAMDNKLLFTQWNDIEKTIYNSTESKIFIINSNGEKQYIANHACCGQFSPDGAMILYTDTSDGEVWIMDSAGNDKTKLTDNGNRKYYPTWSNDGEAIVYTEIINLEEEGILGSKKSEGVQRHVIMYASLEY